MSGPAPVWTDWTEYIIYERYIYERFTISRGYPMLPQSMRGSPRVPRSRSLIRLVEPARN